MDSDLLPVGVVTVFPTSKGLPLPLLRAASGAAQEVSEATCGFAELVFGAPPAFGASPAEEHDLSPGLRDRFGSSWLFSEF